MRKKYRCPQCAQLFSRKWNFREHSRSQHNYDPIPKRQVPVLYPFDSTGQKSAAKLIRRMDKPNNIAGLIAVTDKFTTVALQAVRLQELSTGHAADRRTLDKLNLAESAIDHMLDKYIMYPKYRVYGLSGFVCETCMTFQLEYIRIIGVNITAEGLHRCRRTSLLMANKLHDKKSRLSYLYSESVSIMESLIRCIFPGKIYLKASRLKEGTAGHYQAPDLSREKMGSTHWAWPAIKDGKVDITNSDLKIILRDMMGSYALFTIPKDSYYVIHITR